MDRIWSATLLALCLVSIALLSACDDKPATSVVGPEITPTYTPFPTATVSSTPSPTPTPTVTPTPEPNSLQSMNGGRQSEASDDKVRILALQGKGGSFSVLPCTAYNLMTGEKETCDQEQWQMVQDADIVRWEDCTFGRHGLGGFVSHVTIVLDDESWHTVYEYDKNVCAEANSLQSMNGGRQSEASDDKVRILALQGKGGSFSVLPCTAYNLMTGEKETCDQEQWQMVQDADIVRWKDCAFGRHGLGSFVSHVTIVLDDESWHTVYVYDKNVC